MIKICYFCGQRLTYGNKSLEHIIPNALGGKLKSNDILCKNCNSKMGETIDSNLVKIFAPFNIGVNPIRDRKLNQKIVVNLCGQKVCIYPNNRITTPFKPIITQNGDKEQIQFSGFFTDDKDCDLFIGQCKECVNSKFADKPANIQITKEIIKQPLILYDFMIPFNDSLIFGYLKILFGFCAYHNKFQCIDSNIIQSFKECNIQSIQATMCKSQAFGTDKESYHRIYLIGKQNINKFFGIVSIYDFSVIFCLNDNYQGKNFRLGYCYDTMQCKIVDENLELNNIKIINNR